MSIATAIKRRLNMDLGPVKYEDFLDSLPDMDREGLVVFVDNLNCYFDNPPLSQDVKDAILPINVTLTAVGVPVSGFGYDPRKREFTTESSKLYLKLFGNYLKDAVRLEMVMNAFGKSFADQIKGGRYDDDTFYPTSEGKPIELLFGPDNRYSFDEYMRIRKDRRSPIKNKYCIIFQRGIMPWPTENLQ